MTLFSISSKTWSWTFEPFPDQVYFVTDCSLYFLVFLLKLLLFFSNSSMLLWLWGKSSISCENSNDFLNYNRFEGKGCQRKQTVNDFRKWVQYQKARNLHINNHPIFVSLIYTFSLAGNIFDFTPIQRTNREKYFNHIINKEKMPTPAGKKHLSFHFFFDIPRNFHLWTEKRAGLIRQKWISKWLFPHRHKKR